LRDTIAPTVLTAGVANNVIPAEARANLNVRLLPGDSIDALVNELNKLMNDPQVRLEVQPNAGLAAPPSSLESDFYNVITKVASREFGGAPALPFQSTWLTDSAQLRLHNVQAYGLVPFPLTDDDLKRMHGNDERIPLAAFDKDVARLNFSHGTHEEHAKNISTLRAASIEHEKPIAILADLQGPKIRTGPLAGGGPVLLRTGQKFIITTAKILGDSTRVNTVFTPLPREVHRGDRILLSDGLIELGVERVSGRNVTCEVVN